MKRCTSLSQAVAIVLLGAAVCNSSSLQAQTLKAVGAANFTTGAAGFTSTAMDIHGNSNIVYSDTTSFGSGKANLDTYQANTAVPTTAKPNNLELYAFPNPCNGSFNIQAKTAMNFTVVDNAGQTVDKGELNASNNYAAVVTGLAKGSYFILAGSELQTTMIVVK